jgi:cytochrome c
VQQPDVWYGYGVSPEFPELGEGGIGPMAGPAYDYSRRSNSRVKWPEYWDGAPLFYEWTRDYIKEFRLGADGRLAAINPVLNSFEFIHPMDLEFGPDGALYTLEYGEGFFLESPDAQLARIDYVRGNRTPVPEVSATPTQGDPPMTVQFSSAGTHDPDGDRLRYEWDFDEDGRVDSRSPNPTYTFRERAVHMSTLKVTDRTGRSASDAVQIIVGNDTPDVEFVRPVEGQPFQFGDVVEYEVSVTDDTPVDCNKVQVSYILGHDDHGHPITSSIGCSGSIQTSAPGHGSGDNLRGVFAATYEDEGVDGEEPLSDEDEVVLTPTGG